MGQYGFKNSKSRRTAKVHDWFKSYKNVNIVFSKNSKTSNIGMWDVYPEEMTRILHCALRYQFGQAQLTQLKFECAAQYSSHYLWINTPTFEDFEEEKKW